MNQLKTTEKFQNWWLIESRKYINNENDFFVYIKYSQIKCQQLKYKEKKC